MIVVEWSVMFTTMHGRVEFMVSRVWYGREYAWYSRVCGRVECMV